MDGQWDRLLRQSPQHSVTPPDAIERLRFEQRPHLALLAMPDSDFRSALEHGIAAAFEAAELQYDTPDPVRYHVNALFHRRGIPYEVFGTGSLIYRGDEGTRDIVLAPALAALADRRLAGVRAEFEDAVAKLGAGGPKDLEDAIEESRKAVEGTMKVLIDLDPRVQLPRRQMTDDLIRTLVDGGVVESETRPLLEGVSRVANSLASHSAAGEVRNTPRDLAAATVSAAATAIAFLAARLP